MNHSPARRLLWSMLRRCPNCGSGNVFRSYMHQRDRCPSCDLRLDRGERDFFIGAYTINLIVAEMLVFFGGLAVLMLTWPDVPWDALMYGLGGLMVIGPIVLYPFSRQVWLATDLILRPSEPADFVHPDDAVSMGSAGSETLQA
jgi:uncharacterized protein (DUF983 family)